MASRATIYWRSMLNRAGRNRWFATSTTPKMGPAVPAVADFAHAQPPKQRSIRGDFVPVYVALGMIVLSLSFGAHIAKQQLLYAPNVYLNKKRRETCPEVNDPDYVLGEADKFVTKSFFRRVARIQAHDHVIPDPIGGDAINLPRKAETLKSVGVEVPSSG